MVEGRRDELVNVVDDSLLVGPVQMHVVIVEFISSMIEARSIKASSVAALVLSPPWWHLVEVRLAIVAASSCLDLDRSTAHGHPRLDVRLDVVVDIRLDGQSLLLAVDPTAMMTL